MSDGPEWFAPKRYGYGSSLPIAWQGWALTLGFVAICIGLSMSFSNEPLRLFALLAPLVGAFLVANYYAFDVYDGPPYYRNSEAGDMPALAVYLGTLGALATGFLTWHRRRFGVVVTVPVCLGCAVLVFFSHVFH